MTHAAEIHFTLCGEDFDPAELTRLAGLRPTSIFRTPPPMAKRMKWKVSLDKVDADCINIYEMASTLVAQLQPHVAGIAHAKQELELQAVLEVVLWVAADDSACMPAIGFESEVIAFLNEVGASIDVDMHRQV